MKDEDRQTNNLENKEIYFTIIFGFLIRGIESKVFRIIGIIWSNHYKDSQIRIQGKIKSEFSNCLIILPCCEISMSNLLQ